MFSAFHIVTTLRSNQDFTPETCDFSSHLDFSSVSLKRPNIKCDITHGLFLFLSRMSGNWSTVRLSSLAPPIHSVAPPSHNTSQFPPLADWEAPSFTWAAKFRVGATVFLFAFAACSNLALLVSVWCGRGQRLASHLRPLMLSLASADLMMTFVVMPLDAVWNVTVQWYGGDALCKLLCFLKLFAMHASAFILVVISLDRQHAILHPLDALSAHCRNRRMLLLAWSLSLLLASPQVTYHR